MTTCKCSGPVEIIKHPCVFDDQQPHKARNTARAESAWRHPPSKASTLLLRSVKRTSSRETCSSNLAADWLPARGLSAAACCAATAGSDTCAAITHVSCGRVELALTTVELLSTSASEFVLVVTSQRHGRSGATGGGFTPYYALTAGRWLSGAVQGLCLASEAQPAVQARGFQPACCLGSYCWTMPGIRCALSHIAEMPKLTWNAMTSARQTTSMPPALSSSPRAKLVRLLGGVGAKAIWPAQRKRRCGYDCCGQRVKDGDAGFCDLVTDSFQVSLISTARCCRAAPPFLHCRMQGL